MSTISHQLTRTLDVWRPETAPDGSGGQTVTLTQVGEVWAKVDQPSAEERAVGQQWGAEHSHNIFLDPDADVRRGDELRGDGQTFRVLATVQPSRPIYRKCPASELTQIEGA
jgi:SPP1 family predicted phage head-tail adaptor